MLHVPLLCFESPLMQALVYLLGSGLLLGGLQHKCFELASTKHDDKSMMTGAENDQVIST